MREKLIKNMGYLIVVLDIAIFFISSYVFVEGFNDNILATVVNGGLLFVGAVIASNALMKQGILKGRDNNDYKGTLGAHITQKQKVFPKLKYLQKWLDRDYNALMKIGRTVYVNSAGYDYEELFTEEGKALSISVPKPTAEVYKTFWQKLTSPIRRLVWWISSDDWKIYREKKSYIQRAKHYQVTRQTNSYLLNIDEERDPNNYGITETQYTKKQSRLSVISRLIFSVLLQSIAFGFYGFNMETLLIQMLNVVLILISAIYSMYNAYFFMVKTHRETIIKKINKLEEFDNADLSLLEGEEDELCAEIPSLAQSNLVEEVCGESLSGCEDNICGEPNTGI